MAGLEEMMRYAVAQQRPNPVAEGLKSAVQGGFQGFSAGLKEKNDSVVRAAKMVEIESKIKEMKMQENMAKAFGLLPYSDDELAAGRDVAFSELGTKPKGHSKAAGLESFYNPDSEQLTKNWSAKGGFSVSVRPKTAGKGSVAGASAERAKKTAIESLATKFALRHKASEFKNAGRRDEEIGMMMMGYVPTMDEVKKFYPLAEQYYGGDRSSFDKLYDDSQNADDPQQLFTGDEEAN